MVLRKNELFSRVSPTYAFSNFHNRKNRIYARWSSIVHIQAMVFSFMVALKGSRIGYKFTDSNCYWFISKASHSHLLNLFLVCLQYWLRNHIYHMGSLLLYCEFVYVSSICVYALQHNCIHRIWIFFHAFCQNISSNIFSFLEFHLVIRFRN